MGFGLYCHLSGNFCNKRSGPLVGAVDQCGPLPCGLRTRWKISAILECGDTLESGFRVPNLGDGNAVTVWIDPGTVAEVDAFELVPDGQLGGWGIILFRRFKGSEHLPPAHLPP